MKSFVLACDKRTRHHKIRSRNDVLVGCGAIDGRRKDFAEMRPSRKTLVGTQNDDSGLSVDIKNVSEYIMRHQQYIKSRNAKSL